MHALRSLIIGGIIVSLVAVALVASGSLARLTTFAGSSTPAPTPNAATATPDVQPTPTPATALPAGLSGELTFRRGDELITLRLPEAIEVARELAPSATQAVVSADGAWQARPLCGDDHTCTLELARPGVTRSLETGGYVGGLAWSTDNALAYSVGYYEGDSVVGRELFVIDDAGLAQPRVVLTTDFLWRPFAWLPDGDLLVALNEGGGASLLRFGADGTPTEIAQTSSRVAFLYPSPDSTLFAFTQTDSRGWRLAALDAASGEIHDYGTMGSDGPDGEPIPVSPEQKGPMGIAWSPDSSMLAFGGGSQPPFTMTILDLASGAVSQSVFEEGYAGEIEWTADGSRIAVSTYDLDRTRHEVYVVDPATGEARYLVSGCLVEWSPDGRFIALHAEKQPGIAIVDADTGQHGMLTDDWRDVPVAWEEG